MMRAVVVSLFAIGCLLIFNGQQRYAPQRPAKVSSSAGNVSPKTTPSDVSPTSESAEPVEKSANTVTFMPLVVLTPDDLVWPERAQGDRSTAPQSITLLGDTRAEGLYVIRTRIPKGKQIVPHVHGDSRSVVVISGTYYYGIGETFDAKQLRAFPPGSFLTEPAGMPHYSWAKDDEVVLQTTAIGPSSTRVLPDAEEKKELGARVGTEATTSVETRFAIHWTVSSDSAMKKLF